MQPKPGATDPRCLQEERMRGDQVANVHELEIHEVTAVCLSSG